MIRYPDERGYPVRLRQTGRLLGYLRCAPLEDGSVVFWLSAVNDAKAYPVEGVRRVDDPLPERTRRLVMDPESRCLWADGSEFLLLEGTTPA